MVGRAWRSCGKSVRRGVVDVNVFRPSGDERIWSRNLEKIICDLTGKADSSSRS